ncbi:uncharacterized protein LOC124435167 [Xenia sp. Carnegie-2017]|uniref:uncharacterized protein LOC124435167 n=1 Tax=Xenia sp. Carnegie-2017 TaxID=2897299 RepID=UPI001F048013|nr:uncharacterized protein LOC124435167 [Xenia sp. Carnegie-2017]
MLWDFVESVIQESIDTLDVKFSINFNPQIKVLLQFLHSLKRYVHEVELAFVRDQLPDLACYKRTSNNTIDANEIIPKISVVHFENIREEVIIKVSGNDMWFVHQTSVTTVDFDGKNLPVDFVRSTGSQVQTRIKKKSITYEENVCVRMKTHFEKSKYLESFTALAKTTTYSITQRQEQRLKRKFARKRVLLCQTDLKVLFPSSECQDKEKTNRCIRSPITLLIEGEKINEELSEEITSDASSLSFGVSSSSMNSKMLVTLNILRSKFKTCSSLLSAFMQSQVQIPLEKPGNDSDVNELAKHANSFRLSV